LVWIHHFNFQIKEKYLVILAQEKGSLLNSARKQLGINCLRTLLCGVADVLEAIGNLGRPIPGMFQECVKFVSSEDARSLIP